MFLLGWNKTMSFSISTTSTKVHTLEDHLQNVEDQLATIQVKSFSLV